MNAPLHAALRGKLYARRLVVGASGPFPPRDVNTQSVDESKELILSAAPTRASSW